MHLVERDGFLALLQEKFKNVAGGEGQSLFVSGESGIGKTSLVKAFCNEHKEDCTIYQGACDALFTPRPLAPLYDIIWQVNGDLWPNSHTLTERTELFATFFRELKNQKEITVIIFEDIHWADEATLDFIKFLARRIAQLRCLFILTYRDNETLFNHSIRNILGQLPPDSFTRLPLTVLSREAVDKMAADKGYNGEDVYAISGGNPFYVTEILSSYSLGVPESIKDAVLSAYNLTGEPARQVWNLLSVIPTGFEIKYLEKFEPLYASAIENCLDLNIIIIRDGLIFFKHELFRRTIENSLSPLKRVSLNKKILELLQDSFEQHKAVERIIHHAKNANEYDTVVRYAPLAARQAASLGAHTEASKLYLSAIEYYQGRDPKLLIEFYEAYAYECYLTNQVKEAIIYTGKALHLWKEKKDIEKMGNAMRFLSRLYWLDSNRKNAENFAQQAIDALNDRPSTPEKAMAFSNISQLKMLLAKYDECVDWGEKAIIIARELGNEETLSHALNNIGSVLMNRSSSKQKGIDYLQQSLDLALKNAYHEHAARAYSNMASNLLQLKEYTAAKRILAEGILYCEERDLDSWHSNMLGLKARWNLDAGHWKEGYDMANALLINDIGLTFITIGALIVTATIKMRRGDADSLPLLLQAETKALETMELQRIIPSLIASLEYEWLTGEMIIKKETIDYISGMIEQSMYTIENNEFSFWLRKSRGQLLSLSKLYEGYDAGSAGKAQKAAALWNKLGNPYAEAMLLFEGDDDNKRQAIAIVQHLGADAVSQKMKLNMRSSGIKSIPRGLRKSTRSNAALLTSRELDVLQLLKEGLQNKEIAGKLFISAKTVDHHISSILFKLDVNSRVKAVNEGIRQEILK